MNRENCLAVLLPTGSESETVRGISHLYEHLLLTYVKRRATVPGLLWGHTTEDYIVLFFENSNGLDIVSIDSILRDLGFDSEEMVRQKKALQVELEREKESKDEMFFRKVWQGTGYERSPLGDIREISAVTAKRLEAFRARLSAEDWYYYTPGKGVETVIQGSASVWVVEEYTEGTVRRRDVSFNGKRYEIYYFSRDIEEMVLLVQMLKILNPRRHVQLSEKKKRSALIMEKGIRFPEAAAVPALKKKALQALHKDIEEIKQDFESSAVNCLESVYFYGLIWEERLNKLNRVSDETLSSIEQAFDHGKGDQHHHDDSPHDENPRDYRFLD